jgi:hypothetical protein
MSENPVALTRHDWLISLGLAVLVLVAASLRMAPGVCGKLHDDAIYVSTAKALSNGLGYRQIHVPGSPLQTKYPLLYPALLAVVWHLWPSFPENLVAMQAVSVLCAAATVAMGYLYVVRFGYCSRAIAGGSGLVCAMAPYFLYFGVHTMAEMLFALLSIIALWGAESFLLRPDMTKRGQFVWGVVLALPFLCRTIGAMLIVSSLWVVWRHGRPLRWYASGTLSAAAPWVLWSLLGRGIWDQNPIDGYYTDYFGCWSSTGTSLVGRVFLLNSLMIAYGTGVLSLEGIAPSLEPWLGRWGACMVLRLVGLAPWLAMMRDLRQRRALPWMLAANLTAMLVWPWPPYRFLVPILPFLVAYLSLGCAAVVKPPRGKVDWRFAGMATLGAIALANASLLACHAMQVRHTGFPLAQLTDAPVAWSSYERTFSWLRANSQAQDIIASGVDSMVALYTDRRAFRPIAYNPGRLFYGENGDALLATQEVAAILKRYRPRYLVQSPMPDVADEKLLAQALHELRELYPDWLEVAYQDTDTRFVVFELDWKNEPVFPR